MLRRFGLRIFVLVGLLPPVFFTREPAEKLGKLLASMLEALLEPHEAAERITLVAIAVLAALLPLARDVSGGMV